MSSTIDTLDRLIAFPTVSRDSNLDLIDWLGARLADLGARIATVRDATGAKANLVASLGPEGPDGIVLSGHSDVVPVEGQAWTTDPFRLTRRDGRLYGRGSSDMKGFLAAMLTVAGKAARAPLARPLHLVVSHDEEIGCVGVRSLLARLKAEGFRAAGCVIGEPTEMQVATGHKGKLAGRIVCRGKPAHSANPHLGVNAIHLGARMVGVLEQVQARLAETGPRDNAYPVPYTTVHVGLIQGGTALNIVPDRCMLDFEIRLVPPDDALVLVEEIRARAPAFPPDSGMEIEVVNSYPGLDLADSHPFANAVRAASGGNGTVKLAFGSEGGLMQQELGLPTVVYGPGSIDRAHKADEYVMPEELDACDLFLERLLARLVA
jgi:acetylornithine deacetylase